MKKLIPNLDTISTIMERMAICNVKKSQLSYKLSNDSENEDLQYKVKVQTEISKDIKSILLASLEKAFNDKKYLFYRENRTLV